MLTSRTQPRLPQPSTAAQRRLPPLASLAIILLIVISVVLGLTVLALKLWMPALLLFSLAAGLTLGYQTNAQSRQANARFEEMTRELRLIRLGLASSALATERAGPDSPAD